MSSSLGSNSEIDDPGRDPEGSPGTEGETMMPEAPTDDDSRA